MRREPDPEKEIMRAANAYAKSLGLHRNPSRSYRENRDRVRALGIAFELTFSEW